MLSLEDCISLCGLTEEEVRAIAQHEHIPEIAAAQLGNYLVDAPGGEQRIKAMIRDDIAEAVAQGRPERAAALKLGLREFVLQHPRCEERHRRELRRPERRRAGELNEAELDAIHERRAVRAYTGKQPNEFLIRELLDAAVHAPTAMHLEPWGFAIVQDNAVLKRYSDQAKAMMRAPGGAVGRGSAGRSAHDYPAMLDDPAFNIFYDAGTLVVICRRMGGPFADADCWLAAENLMLAAAEKGLGSCCIGFAVPVLNTPEAKRELNIPAEGAAVAPVILGYARGKVPAVPRKPPEILSWLK